MNIGQTGSLGKRLNEHDLDPKREFWNRALVAISLAHSLTQTHAMYLEWCSIQEANNAQGYSIENGNAGSKPCTPPSLEADCQEIFDTIRTLVATMGQPVFEPLAVRRTEPVSNPTNTVAGAANPMNSADTDMLLYCEGLSASAKAQHTEEGLVVLKGSRGRIEAAPSFGQRSAGKNRQRLIDSGVLLMDGSSYVFQKDVLFGSPSGASKVVLARSSNGWTDWRDARGKTLDELKRQKSDAAERPN